MRGTKLKDMNVSSKVLPGARSMSFMTPTPTFEGFCMLLNARFMIVLFSFVTDTRSAIVASPASSTACRQMLPVTLCLPSLPSASTSFKATPAPHRSMKGYVLSGLLAQITQSAGGNSSLTLWWSVTITCIPRFLSSCTVSILVTPQSTVMTRSGFFSMTLSIIFSVSP